MRGCQRSALALRIGQAAHGPAVLQSISSQPSHTGIGQSHFVVLVVINGEIAPVPRILSRRSLAISIGTFVGFPKKQDAIPMPKMFDTGQCQTQARFSDHRGRLHTSLRDIPLAIVMQGGQGRSGGKIRAINEPIHSSTTGWQMHWVPTHADTHSVSS